MKGIIHYIIKSLSITFITFIFSVLISSLLQGEVSIESFMYIIVVGSFTILPIYWIYCFLILILFKNIKFQLIMIALVVVVIVSTFCFIYNLSAPEIKESTFYFLYLIILSLSLISFESLKRTS